MLSINAASSLAMTQDAGSVGTHVRSGGERMRDYQQIMDGFHQRGRLPRMFARIIEPLKLELASHMTMPANCCYASVFASGGEKQLL